MTSANSLEFCGWVPSRGGDVDSRSFLEIETLTTTFDLDDEDRASSRLFERVNLLHTHLFRDRPIDPENRARQLRLNVVHLTLELTEDKGFLVGVFRQ